MSAHNITLEYHQCHSWNVQTCGIYGIKLGITNTLHLRNIELATSETFLDLARSAEDWSDCTLPPPVKSIVAGRFSQIPTRMYQTRTIKSQKAKMAKDISMPMGWLWEGMQAACGSILMIAIINLEPQWIWNHLINQSSRKRSTSTRCHCASNFDWRTYRNLHIFGKLCGDRVIRKIWSII